MRLQAGSGASLIAWTVRRPAGSPGAVQWGTFVNGDYWVIGPVVLEVVEPGHATVGGADINGSQINPVFSDTLHMAPSAQGYDGRGIGYIPTYSQSLNATRTLPITLQPGSSLVTTRSRTDFTDTSTFADIDDAAVLTVLSTVPPANAFRPAYAGTNKSVSFTESSINWAQLLNLTPTSGSPTPAALAPLLGKVWLDFDGWGSRYIHPRRNMPDYGRDLASLLGEASVVMNFNYVQAEKRSLVINFIQIGIDFFGNVENNWTCTGPGGHCSGRKAPILIAGKLLGNSAMVGIGSTHLNFDIHALVNGVLTVVGSSRVFGEDAQVFNVAQTSPGVYNYGHGGYIAAHAGLPDFGFDHISWPVNDDYHWLGNPYRRCCSANAWIGSILAIRLMGLQGAWNNQAFFDYHDRYQYVMLNTGLSAENSALWHRAWAGWLENAWLAYRPLSGPIWSCGSFSAPVCNGEALP